MHRDTIWRAYESLKKELEGGALFTGLSLFLIFVFPFIIAIIYFLHRKNKLYRKEIEESQQLLEEMLEEKTSSLRQTTELLKIEMKKLEGIIESIDIGIALVEEKNKIIKVNRAFRNLTGKSLFYLMGKEITNIFLGESDDENQKKIVEKLLQPKAILKLNYKINNELKSLEIRKSPILKEKLSLITVRDVTYLKRWEEGIIRYSQLETLRVVASGLAHDLNNLLAAILNNVELILYTEKNGFSPEIKKRIERIKETCLKAKSLTQELLIYGKSLVLSVETHSLPDLIDEIVKFSLAGSGVRVFYCFDPRAQSVTGDKNLLSVALHNIIINAREALKDRGTIKITAEVRKPNIVISITDDGPGISPENLKKVFTPFFTTKPGGSGLGLFSAKRIIEAHHGKIEIESSLGSGTTVRIYIPYVESTKLQKEDYTKEPVRHEVREISDGERLKILLMDDEKEIRESLKELLEAFNYRVTTCGNGEEALEIFKADPSHEVAILDLTVPGQFDGIRTFLELKKIKPNLRGILATGYAYKRETVNAKEIGFEEVLIKPYSVEALIAILEKISSCKNTNN